jgi:hypothetical protein
MDLIFEWMGLAGTKESITVQPSIVDASDVWSVCFGTAESITVQGREEQGSKPLTVSWCKAAVIKG